MKTQIQTQTVKTRLLRQIPDGSICPECNRILPATIFARREGKKKIYSLNSETVKPILDLAEKHVEKYCKLKLARKPPCSARSS